MSKPHKCPVCNGTGWVQKAMPSTAFDTEECPACKGTCVLWEPRVRRRPGRLEPDPDPSLEWPHCMKEQPND